MVLRKWEPQKKTDSILIIVMKITNSKAWVVTPKSDENERHFTLSTY